MRRTTCAKTRAVPLERCVVLQMHLVVGVVGMVYGVQYLLTLALCQVGHTVAPLSDVQRHLAGCDFVNMIVN